MPNLKQQVAKGAVGRWLKRSAVRHWALSSGDKCGMGQVFPGYEGGLRPEFRFLKDKTVIIQAWKKAQY